MGPGLRRWLPLLLLGAALAGCGGDGVPAADSLEAKLKDANARSNDGTSANREHSIRRIDDRGPRA